MPCIVKPAHPLIKELLGDKEYNSFSEVVDDLSAKVLDKGDAVFLDENGNEITVKLVSLEGSASGSMIATGLLADQTLLRKDFFTMVRWGQAKPSTPVTGDQMRANPGAVESSTDEDLPDNLQTAPLKKDYIKLDMMSSTTYEVGQELDMSPVKVAQREVLKELRDNPDQYELVMVDDQEGIMIDSDSERTGQVLLVVPKGQEITKDNVVSLAIQRDGQAVPLYFEAPLTTTLKTNSFFGYNNTEENSRNTATHDERVRIVADRSGKTIEEIQQFYEESFKQLQELRKKGFVRLEVKKVSKGFRVKNGKSFLELENFYLPSRENIIIEKDGSLTIRYDVDGQEVLLPIYGKRLTDKEIEYLVDNLAKYNAGDAEIRRLFHMILGKKPYKNSFFEGKSLMYNDNGKTVSVTNGVDFFNLLQKSPFRSRSSEILSMDYSLPESFAKATGKHSAWEYFIGNFYTPEIFYEVNGQKVPDVANRYVVFREKDVRSKFLDLLEQRVKELGVTETEITKPYVDTTLGIIIIPKSYVITLEELKELKEAWNKAFPDKKIKATSAKGLTDAFLNTGKVYGGLYKNKQILFTQDSLIEERLHALTGQFLIDNPNHPHTVEVERLLAAARKHYEGQTLPRFMEYTLSNPAEFLARALGDKPTIEFMSKTMPTSFWRRLKDVVNKILKEYGFDVEAHGMFGDLLYAYERIYKAQQEEQITPITTPESWDDLVAVETPVPEVRPEEVPTKRVEFDNWEEAVKSEKTTKLVEEQVTTQTEVTQPTITNTKQPVSIIRNSDEEIKKLSLEIERLDKEIEEAKQDIQIKVIDKEQKLIDKGIDLRDRFLGKDQYLATRKLYENRLFRLEETQSRLRVQLQIIYDELNPFSEKIGGISKLKQDTLLEDAKSIWLLDRFSEEFTPEKISDLFEEVSIEYLDLVLQPGYAGPNLLKWLQKGRDYKKQQIASQQPTQAEVTQIIPNTKTKQLLTDNYELIKPYLDELGKTNIDTLTNEELGGIIKSLCKNK